MPKLKVNGVNLSYADTGTGPETLLFVHGLAFSGQMFEAQIEALKAGYRCVSLDLRGHGQSDVVESGYDIDSFTDDTAAFIEALGIGPCHLVGWSIGGFIGLRLAIRRPALLRSLVLIGAGDVELAELTYGFRITPFLVGMFGMRPAIGSLSTSMFASPMLKDPSRGHVLDAWKKRWMATNATAVSKTARGVIDMARHPLNGELSKIKLPVLSISGEFDAVCAPAVSKRTSDAIPGAVYVAIPRGGHACTIEEPSAVNALLSAFLGKRAAA